MGEEYFFSSPFIKKDRGSVFDVDDQQPTPKPSFSRKLNKKEKRKREEEQEAEKELQQIMVTGYECTIFRDDETAQEVDDGNLLVPWPGDKSLMIDRFDVIMLLDDRKQFKKEKGKKYVRTQKEMEEETECDYERYYDLERADEALEQEEILKRQKMLEDPTAFHSVAFSYGDDSENKYGDDDTTTTTTTPAVVSPESKPAPSDEKPAAEDVYIAPATVPQGIALPTTIKTHKIIDQTAKFVAAKGTVVAEALKKKQANNPHFSFLNEDDKLFPYYSYLVASANGLPYVPLTTVNSPASKQSEKPTVPGLKLEPQSTLPAVVTKAHVAPQPIVKTEIASPKLDIPPSTIVKTEVVSPTLKPTSVHTTTPVHTTSVHTTPVSSAPSYGVVSIPPDDVKSVIDKLISFVEKNGKQFENVVKEKEKNNEKFAFLYPWNQYHAYYKSTVDKALAAVAAAKVKEEVKVEPLVEQEKVEDKKKEEEEAKPEMITEYEITPTSPPTIAALRAENTITPTVVVAPVVNATPSPQTPSILDNLSKKYADDEKKKMKTERLKKAKMLLDQMKTPEERAKEEAEKQKEKDLEFVEKLRQQIQKKEEQKKKDKEYEEYLRSKERSRSSHHHRSSSRRSRSKSRSRSRSRERGRDKKSTRHHGKSKSRSRSRSRDRKDHKKKSSSSSSSSSSKRRKSRSRSRSRSHSRSRSPRKSRR